MIILRVTDVSSACGPYGDSGRTFLNLPDTVRVRRTGTGLALMVPGAQHLFNKAGEYTGTEKTLE